MLLLSATNIHYLGFKVSHNPILNVLADGILFGGALWSIILTLKMRRLLLCKFTGLLQKVSSKGDPSKNVFFFLKLRLCRLKDIRIYESTPRIPTPPLPHPPPTPRFMVSLCQDSISASYFVCCSCRGQSSGFSSIPCSSNHCLWGNMGVGQKVGAANGALANGKD